MATSKKTQLIGLISVSVLLSVTFGCTAHPIMPRFASFEPTTTQIPSIAPDVARRRLDRSRVYWKAASRLEAGHTVVDRFAFRLPDPQHSYVRAIQVDRDRIEFTYVVVEGNRAVIRGLGTVEPSRFLGPENAFSTDVDGDPRQRWREIGVEVGTHDGGAKALTIDDLYDLCDEEIRRPGAGPIRMYFHPSGVLMHCGRTKEECPDCQTISIHAYSIRSISPWARELDLAKWACSEPWGLVLLGAPNWLRSRRAKCDPPALPSSLQYRPQDDSLAGICRIDPSACTLVSTTPTISLGPFPRESELAIRRPLKYLDVGKTDPDARLVVDGHSGAVREARVGEVGGDSVGVWPELLERQRISGD